METIAFADAVARQPATLRAALRAVRAGLPGLPAVTADLTASLAVLAMGASVHAAQALAAYATAAGRAVTNHDASQVGATTTAADWYLAISESGRSPEPLAALKGRTPSVALTNVPDSPVGLAADAVLSLGGLPDAGVYVTGYTATVAALALLGEHAGLPGAADGLDEVPDAVAALLAGPHAALLHLVDAAPRCVESVGGGVSFAAASELALLVREAARTPGASHTPATFVHGPAESLERSDLLVLWGPDPLGIADRFAGEVPTLRVSAAPDADLRLPDLPPLASAVLEGVAAQLIVAPLAGRGFDVGTFRHEFSATKLRPGA